MKTPAQPIQFQTASIRFAKSVSLAGARRTTEAERRTGAPLFADWEGFAAEGETVVGHSVLATPFGILHWTTVDGFRTCAQLDAIAQVSP